MLEASLPGGRVRRDGRDAIAAELAAWWDGPGEVGEWRAGEWPAGAALTAARDGVRRRHYLHLSGDLVARHWVYAMAPASLGGGNSGATLERVTLPDGTPGIAKRVVPGGDWLGRAVGGRAITAELWNAGVLQRLPAVDRDRHRRRRARRRWLAHPHARPAAHLVDADGPISRARHREVMAAAAALHAAFRGERIEAGSRSSPPGDQLAGRGRRRARRQRRDPQADRDRLGGVRRGGRRRRRAGRARQPRRPGAAGEGPAAGGTTLIHGDLRDENLGFVDGRVVMLDWDIAGEGTPALEVAWYLCHDAWRTRPRARSCSRTSWPPRTVR